MSAQKSRNSKVLQVLSETEKFDELAAITKGPMFGSVAGVEIDLRHPELPADEWETEGFRNGSPDSPWIQFPFSDARTRAEYLENANQEWKQEEVRKRWNNDYGAFIAAAIPQYFAEKGDKIKIMEVDCQVLQAPVEDIIEGYYDTQRRLAWLCVTKANGTIEALPVPMLFTGTLSLFGFSQYENPKFQIGNYFEIIAKRAEAFKANKSDETSSDKQKDLEIIFNYILNIRSLKERLIEEFAALPGENGPRSRAIRIPPSVRFNRTMNASVMLGYLWAQMELASGILPLAEMGKRQQDAAQRGGKTSGETRRNTRAVGWEEHAKKLAIKAREDDPSLSQDNVAHEISGGWKIAEHKCPGHTTLKSFISRLEKDGTLTPRPQSTK